jgi:hypothetical protein
MVYAILLVGAEVSAVIVKKVVSVPEQSMREELHPRLLPDPLRTAPEGTDGHQIDITNLGSQFLKHPLPRRDRLISSANRIVQKDDRIVSTKTGSEQVTPADEKRIKFSMIQIVRESELMEHVVAALARAR